MTLSFSGFLWIVKPFFPATITLRLVIEEDGEEYHWLQDQEVQMDFQYALGCWCILSDG